MLLTNAAPWEIEVLQTAPVDLQADGESPLKKIIRRAKQIHRKRGGLFGYDFDDWSEAWEERAQNIFTGSSSDRSLVSEPENRPI